MKIGDSIKEGRSINCSWVNEKGGCKYASKRLKTSDEDKAKTALPVL